MTNIVGFMLVTLVFNIHRPALEPRLIEGEHRKYDACYILYLIWAISHERLGFTVAKEQLGGK